MNYCLCCHRHNNLNLILMDFLEYPSENTINQNPYFYNYHNRDPAEGGFWDCLEFNLCDNCYNKYTIFRPVILKAKSENHARQIMKIILD